VAKAKQSQRRFLLETSQAVFEGGALRQVIAEAQDGFIVLRLRGLKTGFAVPWGAVYHLAAAQAAEREFRARRAEIGF
jgi:hypothetical protein